MIKKFAPALIGIALLAVVGCGGGKGGGDTLASINGVNISMDEFHRYLEYKPEVSVATQGGAATNANVSGTLGFQAFQDLLRQKLLLQMAEDEGVLPSDDDVLKELDFQKKRNPNFVRELQSRGLSTGEIKENLKIDLARERLITKGIKVEPVEVDRYVDKHPKEFEEPSTAEMLWVFVKDPNSKGTVDQELKAGQSFAAVAGRYSQFQDAATNQNFPIRLVERMPPAIQDIVAKTPEASQSAWLQLQDGWAKFYIEKKTEAKDVRGDVKGDPIKKEWVQRQIALRRGLQANDIDKRLLDKVKASKIDVKYEDLKEQWKKAFDSLKTDTTGAKAPTATGSAGADEKDKGTLPAGTTGATTAPPATTGAATPAPGGAATAPK